MTRKQMAVIIAVNAAISTVITLAVVVLAAFWLRERGVSGPEVTASSGEPSTALALTEGAGQMLPTPTPILHVVRAGDTITGLALQYDVPAEEIVAANRLENPNFLQVGMELVIPVGGVPVAAATFTPAPTPTETPIPFEPPSAASTATAAALIGATITPLPTPLPTGGDLRIEIAEVFAAGDPAREYVRLTNTGQRYVELNGWTLSSVAGNTYTFSGLTLWPGGAVVLHTGVGEDDPPSDFYWGRLQAAWAPGELLTLRDAAGQVVHTLVSGQPR